MLARRRVCARSPQQRLVERPCADHDHSNVRSLRGVDGGGDTGDIVRPELRALGVVDFHGCVGEELGEACERGDAVVGCVEKYVVAELRVKVG